MLYLLILAGFLGLGYLLISYSLGLNKEKAQVVLGKAIAHGSEQYAVLRNVQLSFWYSDGNKHYPETTKITDLFIFHDFIFWARERRMFVKRFIPTVISFRNLRSALDSSTENYFPEKFIYWEEKRMEVQINLVSSECKHITAVLTLKHLTAEYILKVKAFESRIKPIPLESTSG